MSAIRAEDVSPCGKHGIPKDAELGVCLLVFLRELVDGKNRTSDFTPRDDGAGAAAIRYGSHPKRLARGRQAGRVAPGAATRHVVRRTALRTLQRYGKISSLPRRAARRPAKRTILRTGDADRTGYAPKHCGAGRKMCAERIFFVRRENTFRPQTKPTRSAVFFQPPCRGLFKIDKNTAIPSKPQKIHLRSRAWRARRRWPWPPDDGNGRRRRFFAVRRRPRWQRRDGKDDQSGRAC